MKNNERKNEEKKIILTDYIDVIRISLQTNIKDKQK